MALECGLDVPLVWLFSVLPGAVGRDDEPPWRFDNDEERRPLLLAQDPVFLLRLVRRKPSSSGAGLSVVGEKLLALSLRSRLVLPFPRREFCLGALDSSILAFLATGGCRLAV